MKQISWSKEPRKLTLNNEFYPDYSLRRQGTSLYKEPITNCKSLEEFFLNTIVPVWNSPYIDVKEAK